MVFGGETADSYYDEGVTASMKGDTALAVTHFEKALQLDPYHVASCHQLGRCKMRQGALQQAVECFYRAIKARPNPLPPRLDLGFALLEGGNIVKAEALFKEVIDKRPENARALLGAAACAFAKGEWDQAFIVVSQAVDLGGAGFATYYLRGRAARLSGLLDVAVESFELADALIEKLIEGNPEQPEGYYLRGELNVARENFALALDAFQAAENRIAVDMHYYSYGEHFDRVAVLAKRGMCLLRLGRTEDARALGESILAIDPKNRVAALLTRSS